MQHAFVIAHLLLGGRAGAHLNPTNARADAAVVGDQGQADLAASLDVCPSAKFTRPVAEGNDPDQIAVLLVEEGDRAGFDRLVEWELLDPAHQVRADLLVEQPQHAIDLVRRQGPGKAEIEGCVVGLHRGTSLDGLLAQDIAQGPVQEVRCRVMSRHCLTPGGIHHCMDSIAWLQPVRGDLDAMPDRLTLGLNIDDASRGALPGQRPGVGRLPAALGVKRGLVQEYVGVLRLAGHRENIGDSGVAFQPVISDEPAGAPGQRRGKGARRDPASITLALHQGCHSLKIHAYTSLLSQLGSELDREAERVMEVEHLFGVKSSALEQRFQSLHSLAQGHPEAFLLGPHDFGDPSHLRFDLGIDIAEQSGDDRHAR